MKHRHNIIAFLRVLGMLVIVLLMLGGQVSLAAGTIIYVDADATGVGDGSSWADAFTGLQPALEAAVSGDQIWVAAGTYKPTAEHGGTGDRYKSFQMKNGVAIYGGFDPSTGDIGWEDRDWITNLTILSGDLNGDDGPNFANNSDNSYHVFFHSAEITKLDTTAILDGFTITGGNANESGDHECGGGVFNYMSSPTITNVVFMHNYANIGGGMFNTLGNAPVLIGITFIENWASFGGGMANQYYSSPSLIGVYFLGNGATAAGAGMYNYFYTSPNLTNVLFSANRADSQGGGMYNSNRSLPTLTNATFADNLAPRGAGMYNLDSDPIISNAIFWGGMEAQFNNLYSEPEISYSDIQFACPLGAVCDHVIGLDPQFVRNPSPGDDDRWGTPDDDYGDLRLQLTSPAIDAGDNNAVPSGVITDLNGDPRFVDILLAIDTGNGTAPIVDMGAYEAYAETIPPTVASILRADPSPTNADSVDYTVTFSEEVMNVEVSDFILTTSGLSDASVMGVSGGAIVYTVTVSTGVGEGTLRMDIPETASISDMVGNPLSGLPYITGESYVIDKIAPTVVSILRADPNPTDAASVRYTVTFSEAVSGVSVEDFNLFTTGTLSGVSVESVSGTGSSYIVTVNTGTGIGSLRLDIPEVATITDQAGNPLSNLPYENGESYSICVMIYLPMLFK